MPWTRTAAGWCGSAVLDSQNGQWRAVVSAAGQGTDVDQLQFASVTGRQAVDLVVGWIDETRTYETVTVYTFRQERLQNLYEDSYTELLVDDLDQDGMDELLLLRSSSGGRVTAKLVENSLFSLEVTDERRLNLSFANILQVQSGWLSQEVYGVAVDGYTSDYRYSSEAIVARDGQLAFPFDREGDSDDLYDLVTRSSGSSSRTWTGTGCWTSPPRKPSPATKASDPEDTLFLTRYLHFNRGRFPGNGGQCLCGRRQRLPPLLPRQLAGGGDGGGPAPERRGYLLPVPGLPGGPVGHAAADPLLLLLRLSGSERPGAVCQAGIQGNL